MAIKAVIFDWGGTLTPWFPVELSDMWRNYSSVYDPARADELAHELARLEQSRWSHQFSTHGEVGTGALDELFIDAGVDLTSPVHFAALEAYFRGWDGHTYTDPDAMPLLEGLRGTGYKTAVLSNTMWSREHHEGVLERDGVKHLFDYMLFTSETSAGKPHASVFADVLYNLDVQPHEAAFVGDRLFDDIYGAQTVGMKGIWVPHSVIPESQMPTHEVQPDAVVARLFDVLSIVEQWNSQDS